MPEHRSNIALIVVLSFVAGAAVGVAGTLALGGHKAPLAAAASALPPAPDVAPPAAPASNDSSTGVYINERLVSPAQLDDLRRSYGAAPPPAHYWYDRRSGLYGVWGFEAGGYIRAGHDLGGLPENASRGNTGVFINGRQLNMNEAMYIRNTFGAVYQGRWWLDGSGNFGQEGDDMPLGNLVVALQQAQQARGGGGGYRWRDEITRSSGGAENGCVWINSPGSSYSSAGC